MKWTEADERLLLELAATPKTLVEISEHMHRSRESVRSHLARCKLLGGNPRTGRPPNNTWTPAEVEQAIAMRQQGVSVQEIAKQMQRGEHSVYRKLQYELAPPEKKQALRKRQRTSMAEYRERCRDHYDSNADELIKDEFLRLERSVATIAQTIGHSAKSVNTRATKLGLRQTKHEKPVVDDWVYSRAELIDMNHRFCCAMYRAIQQGLEVAPVEVCTTASTRKPIRREQAPYLPIRRGVAGECADV